MFEDERRESMPRAVASFKSGGVKPVCWTTRLQDIYTLNAGRLRSSDAP
jgi:hypothetical protein